MKDLIKEKVYLGRNNTNDLLVKANGSALNLSSVIIAKIVQVDGLYEISSAEYASAFDWTNSVKGKIVLDLASAFAAEGITAGKYNFRLVLYDAVNTNGIEWETIIQFEVFDY